MQHSPFLRRCAAVTGALALALGLSACTEDADPTGALGLVVGGRANMPVPGLDGASVDAAHEAVLSQADLAVVVADGDPYLLVEPTSMTVRDDNHVVQQQDREANLRLIARSADEARARTPETDLLGALDLAERAIDSAPGPHTLVVVDSGLSTAGPLDFREEPGLLDQDPAAVARGLAGAGELPDLSGVRVVFQGLGDTAPEQPDLGRSQRNRLIALWVSVAEEAGAEEVVVERSPLVGEPADAAALPPVTPVAFAETPVCEVVELPDDVVAFEPDSARFADPDAARERLAPVAEAMVERQLTARLTGTTADVGDLAGQRELSLARAEAVRDALADLGADVAAMVAVGLGSAFDGYVPDRDADGRLIAEAAAANRKVVVELGGASGVTCG